MQTTRWKIARLAVMPLAGLALLGCGDSQPKAVVAKLAEVQVSRPITREITNYDLFTGRTEAVEAVDVRARVTGYLQKTNFKEGMEVQQGDVLFEIDPRTYQAELDRAEANVVQADARLKRLNTDYQRAVSLLAKRAIGQEEFDKIAGDRAEAEAAVKVVQASRDVARLNLNFCKVVSPISGRISRRLIDPGNLVKADDTVLTTIVSLDPMYVYFDIDERTMLRVRRLIQEGKVKSSREAIIPVSMGLADEEGFPHEGTINFVDNKVDPNTGTLRLRGIFPNPVNPKHPLSPRLFSPGLFTRVRIPIGEPHQAILVSERALGTDQGRKFVYVVNDQDEVVYRSVKIGSLNEGYRVIEEGLTPQERVVVSGLQRVRPGAKVDPREIPMPPSAPAVTPVQTNLPASGGKAPQPENKK